MANKPMDEAEIDLIDRYWRAANYLSVGQIYLMANPLVREPLRTHHLKPRLLGHWGTTPGLNFIYAHLNRLITARDLDMIFVCGPGHGGPAVLANTWLEGTYSEIYPEVSQDLPGMTRLFRQFSFPGGVPSHAAPETPGSIHEGGELGYSLAHAFGAAFDNPDLIVACVVGDGEAETGPLATSWQSPWFLNPATDGAVLPILHLNGYKIANPTVLARKDRSDMTMLFTGLGYEVLWVEGHEPAPMHEAMSVAMDRAADSIATIQSTWRQGEGHSTPPRWPMIILRSPKGWTGPREVDGKKVEDFWRSHQVPVTGVRENPVHRVILEEWLHSYRPDELFDEAGRPRPDIRALPPQGARRMGANLRANGGILRRELVLPTLKDHALVVGAPGSTSAEATRTMGVYLRDVMSMNAETRNFRAFGPDETASNRLDKLFEVTDRSWMGPIYDFDDHLDPAGRVVEVLSEHLCQGWLEGYLLTGRHGIFSCYEAFAHIVDAMFNQHAKWLKVSRQLPWRYPIASLNYLLTSHVWRQDHNGFTHQDPGFVDLTVNKKADIVRVYFPPDANCLLWVTEHCLQTFDRINVIVAGKQPAPQWLSMTDAIAHCESGAGIWDWAGTVQADEEPDVVLACAGDVPTTETIAAAGLLGESVPSLKVRVVNVVDLMALQPEDVHPHGLSDKDFDSLFTTDKPVIFAYHGYPQLIHKLCYRRTNHTNFHVHGYQEEGTTTTPFDMAVLNGLDRFHLAIAALDNTPVATEMALQAGQAIRGWQFKLAKHHDYVRQFGEDMPEVLNWKRAE